MACCANSREDRWPSLCFAPFDLRAAQIAAQIERLRLSAVGGTKAKTRQSESQIGDLTRQKIKVDVQILAIAIAAGAESIITHDAEHFSPLAAKTNIIHEFANRFSANDHCYR